MSLVEVTVVVVVTMADEEEGELQAGWKAIDGNLTATRWGLTRIRMIPLTTAVIITMW